MKIHNIKKDRTKVNSMNNLKSALIVCSLLLFFSCKDDKKGVDQISDTPEDIGQSQKKYMDSELENSLYNGYFIKSDKGYDLLLFEDFIYLLKSNPTEAEKINRFFLHIIPKEGKMINLDFSPSEYSINTELSNNYSNVSVYRRQLPKVDASYEILIGQLSNDNKTWETYVNVANLNQDANKYKNEYVQNTINNRYLKEFESAFNEGYFMKQNTGFDLLLDGHTLYYIKPNGTINDLQDMFFLHVKYEGKKDMQNLDFRGDGHEINKLLGDKYVNLMVIKRDIPNLGTIDEIETGQFDNKSRSWSERQILSKLYDDVNFIYNDQYNSYLK